MGSDGPTVLSLMVPMHGSDRPDGSDGLGPMVKLHGSDGPIRGGPIGPIGSKSSARSIGSVTVGRLGPPSPSAAVGVGIGWVERE
ncbi:hypothetical protein CsatB_012351 [Cannabis sativa]